MNKWTKLLLVTILIAGLVVGMSNALPTRAAPGDVIARINAGGPAVGGWSEDRVTSVVDDQYWLCDGVLQAGANAAAYTGNSQRSGCNSAAATVAGPPADVFHTHRYENPDETMSYSFTVTPGTEYIINLYFAENVTSSRTFSVSVDGDIPAAFSNINLENGTAAVRTATVVAGDASLDLDFIRIAAAPMVSGIEIIEGGEATQVPTDEPTGEPTDEPTGEPTEEPTVEPTEPPVVIPDMFCSLGDGSLNALHCGRPVAIYDESSFEIFGIDINTGNGALAFVVTDEQIAEAGVPEDVPVVIATGQNPYNFRPIVLYRLPSGEFQLNTYYWDGKPYSVKWDEGASTVEVVTW